MDTTEKILLFLGPTSSGKDTAAEAAATKMGALHVSASELLHTEADKHGLPHDRDTLARIKDELGRTYQAPLFELALQQFRENAAAYPGGLVISGLRRVREVEAARDAGADRWFVDAPIEKRYQWMRARGRIGDAVTLKEFIEREQKEAEGMLGEGTDGIYLNGVRKLANVCIINDGSKEELIGKVDELLQQNTKT